MFLASSLWQKQLPPLIYLFHKKIYYYNVLAKGTKFWYGIINYLTYYGTLGLVPLENVVILIGWAILPLDDNKFCKVCCLFHGIICFWIHYWHFNCGLSRWFTLNLTLATQKYKWNQHIGTYPLKKKVVNNGQKQVVYSQNLNPI